MNKKLNTPLVFEFCDGTTAELSLTFYDLYQLRGKNKALYEKYNKIMGQKNITEELGMITVLYAAYVCANISDFDNLMNEVEFMMKCGSDRMAVANAIKDLTQPKKQ